MPPRKTVQPTPELKAEFEKFTKETQAEDPDFVLAYGGKVLTPDEMIHHVREETDIGIQLLTMFHEDEQERAKPVEGGIRDRLSGLLRRLIG